MLKTFLSKYFDKNLFPEAKSRIIEGPLIGGEQYYQFEDINNLPSGRYFAAIDYYDEMAMRCTKEYLTQFCEKGRAITSGKNGNKIDLGTVAVMFLQLEERLKMIMAPETIYKVASVVFFDKTESVYGFDYKHSQNKIAKWKKAEGVYDFFLRQHIKNLTPLMNRSDKDLETYIKVGLEIDKEHSKTISTTLSRRK